MPSITLDESRWPLVIVRIVGTPTDEELDAFLAESTHRLRRNEIQVSIIDVSKADRSPPTQRRKQAEWMRVHDDLLRRRSAGMAYVITNPMVRGVLTAIMWLQPLPVEHTVVGTLEEAERWAIAQLAKRGGAAPPPRE